MPTLLRNLCYKLTYSLYFLLWICHSFCRYMQCEGFSNTDSSCTECGQGLNFYLDSGKCLQCPTINSCLQCNPNDITSCTLCVEGYFVSSAASCSECGLGCKSCTSEAACNVCQPGYILPDTSGICLKCT